MITYDQRQNIKRVPITSYLAQKDIFPVLETGGEYCYFSPFREERTPSFFVNPAKNWFHDFSDGNGGDNIKLVGKLENTDFIGAISILQSVDQSFEIELQTNFPASPQYQSFIKKVVPLTSPALKRYIYQERGIFMDVANKNLSEVHYGTSKGDFFSAGFKNDSGGWELRNPKFKGCIGRKDISVRGNPFGSNVLVFEGFMDYLSLLCLHGKHAKSEYRYIILNSLSMISKLPDLSEAESIQLYLDNDEAGKEAVFKLTEKYEQAVDRFGNLADDFKDLNEMLLSFQPHHS